jgi:2,4-dichlorophenol 6-monooxygenase
MSRALDTDILILGAGPTGMVAALALSRLGVACVVLDPRRAVSAHPKAHELSPRSVEILTGLGIPFEALEAEASPYEDSARVLFCATLGEEIGRIDLQQDGADAKYFQHVRAPRPFLNLSQSALEEVLRAEARRCPSIEMRLGYRWESRVERDGGVRSTARPVEGGAALEIRSRYVLCADGAGSPSRKALGIAMEGPERIQDFVSAYFEHDLSTRVPARAKLYFAMDPRCAGTFVAHHVEKRWVYHVPVFPPHDRVEDLDAPELSRRIARALGGPVEGLRIRSIETWRMTAQVAARFRRGRAFLLGDAAHRFPPTGGLGMNCGIADAHNLCWKLAAVLRGHAAEALLDTYEAERRPVALRSCRASARNYEGLFEIAEALGMRRDRIEQAVRWRARLARFLPRLAVLALFWLAAAALRLRLRRARREPGARAALDAAIRAQVGHFDRLGLDLGVAYESGALIPDSSPSAAPKEDEVSEYRSSTRPGARLDHVWLDRARTRSIHDLIGRGGLTLLVGPEGKRWAGALPERALRDGAARAVHLDAATVEPEDAKALCARLEIGPAGALLIRPDGHVAWRCPGAATDPAAVLRGALEAGLFMHAGAPPGARRPARRPIASSANPGSRGERAARSRSCPAPGPPAPARARLRRARARGRARRAGTRCQRRARRTDAGGRYRSSAARARPGASSRR